MMNDYRIMAMMKLRSIKLRHQLAEETEYTKMLDRKDFADYLRYLQLEEQKAEVVLDEASYRNVEKKIQELFNGIPFGR